MCRLKTQDPGLKTITDPLGYITTNSYDLSENISSLMDAEGKNASPQYKTNCEYNERDLLWKVTDANGGITEYSYDKNGNLTKIKDAKNQETHYTYDGFDRQKCVTYPDDTNEVFGYDKNSNMTSFKNRKGETISYQYDQLNRLTVKSRPGKPNVTYQYNIASRLLEASEGSDVTDYEYDRVGRVKKVTDAADRIVKYEYDDRGLRTKLTYPDNSYVTYQYDAMSRLTYIKDSSSNVLAHCGYDELSRRVLLTLGNDTSAAYEYDIADRLKKLTNDFDNGCDPNKLVFAYNSYDKVGNRLTCKINNADDDIYDYDKLYQLTYVDYSNGNTVSYEYDALGSRKKTVVNSVTTNYSRNNLLNQYSSIGGTTYYYDDNGNLTNDGTYKYFYDCENRLAEVKNQSETQTIATYEYNYLGQRVSKTVGSTTTAYCYSGNQVVAEYQNGVLARKFVYGTGIDEVICMITSSGTYYYHYDGLSSVVALSNADGDIIERYSYDVFGTPTIRDGSGNVISQSAYGNTILFTGRNYDYETGNYYYRARYYKPSIGRFLQTDPIWDLNLHTYCGNNPINWIDPWGLAKIIIYIQEGTPGGDPSSKEALNAYGHAWVEVVDDAGGKTNSGFYPKGKHDDSKRNKNANVVYPIEITEAQAKAAKKYIEEYDGKYNFLTENCTDYVYKVVEKGAEQDIPGSDWGIDYPDKLAEDLKKKQIEEKKSK